MNDDELFQKSNEKEKKKINRWKLTKKKRRKNEEKYEQVV